MFLSILNKLSSMSQRKILALAGATGATMFGLIYATLSSQTAEVNKSFAPPISTVEPSAPTVEVVTAAVDIPAQTVIEEKMLKRTPIPQDMVSTTTVRDTSKLVGKLTRVDVLTNDIITEKKIFHNDEQAGLIGMIPPDCRAISLSVSDIAGVSDSVKPGNYVDVMMIYSNGGVIHSELLLQNVLLLKKSDSAATFALHADEILQLAAVARKGTLYLLMRPLRPAKEFVEDAHYSTAIAPANTPSIEVAQVAQPPTPAFQPPPSPVVNKPAPSFKPPAATTVHNPPAEQGIEIIQGDKVTKK